MALTIVSAVEICKGTNGRKGVDGNNFTRAFIIKTSGSSATATEELVDYSTSPVPALYSAWGRVTTGKRTPICIAKAVSLLTSEANNQWLLTAEYSNDPRKIQLSVKNSDNPWDADPLFSYDFQRYEKALEQDKTSPTPLNVLNAAGDPFDPPIMTEYVTTKVTIKRATRDYDPSVAYTLINTLNNAAVTINGKTVDTGKAKLLRWDGTDAIYYDDGGLEKKYQEETIEIEINTDGFDLVVLNRGYRYRPTAGAAPVRDLDANNDPNPTPRFLAADGTKNDTGTPTTLTFKPYASAAWTALGLA
jgi:hypothetical protein